MSAPKTIFQVDSFTEEPFRGNPAGVCLIDNEMSEDWMQNVAMEMNLSETSFILRDKDSFKIRYFTPAAEVPLCGHATLASAHILYETGIVSEDREIIFISKAGKLGITMNEGWITMDFPAYSLTPSEIPEIIEKILGIGPEEFYKSSHGWTFVVLKSEDSLRGLEPDFRLMKNSGFGDMIVTSPSGDDNYDFCVRCFVPALGIDEDPVTGSAHCALVPYWSQRIAKNEMVSHQVSKRGGTLKVSNCGERVKISGKARTIITGTLLV
jgi:PhzF family phenazine biosynthesis protein